MTNRLFFCALSRSTLSLVCALITLPALGQDPLLTTSDTFTLSKPSCSICGSCSNAFRIGGEREWAEPLPGSAIPVGGTITDVDISGNDLVFDHPFGFDFKDRFFEAVGRRLAAEAWCCL